VQIHISGPKAAQNASHYIMTSCGSVPKPHACHGLEPHSTYHSMSRCARCLGDCRMQHALRQATGWSATFRKDMAALEHRAATLDLSEGCARCGVAVGEPPPATAGISGGAVPPFYLFPSGNAFHGTCLASEVMQLAPPPQQQRIHTLLTRLSQVTTLNLVTVFPAAG